MRILSFNIQNLRLRRPGGQPRLDGARDRDETGESPALDPADRRLAAALLARAGADLVILQEVFDSDTLDWFNTRHLPAAGLPLYPHAHCPPGNDGRGLDVALLSRMEPRAVVSHAEATPASLGLDAVEGCGPDDRIFRRDCLEADLGALTLYICHFKAPYPDVTASWPVRRLEALAVIRLIERRFPDPAKGNWLILGDLNEPARLDAARGRATAPLLAFGEDLTRRIPAPERWSFHLPHTAIYSAPDVMIASPALAGRFPDAVPRLIRSGLDREAARYDGFRYAAVGEHRPHASDHAALVVDLPGL